MPRISWQLTATSGAHKVDLQNSAMLHLSIAQLDLAAMQGLTRGSPHSWHVLGLLAGWRLTQALLLLRSLAHGTIQHACARC